MKIRKPIITRLCAAVTALAILPASISLQAFAAPEDSGEPVNIALNKPYTITATSGGSTLAPAWPDTSGGYLTDGNYPSSEWRDSTNGWVDWTNGGAAMNVQVDIDLGESKLIKAFTADCLNQSQFGLTMPANWAIYTLSLIHI